MTEPQGNPHKNDGHVRTDMDCHECGNNFIAEIDFSVDGQHVVECPHCGHEHCRVIKDGVVTGERFDSRNGPTVNVSSKRVWKATSDVLQVRTSTASHFIREKWLNFGVS